jgi:hypothetical protein
MASPRTRFDIVAAAAGRAFFTKVIEAGAEADTVFLEMDEALRRRDCRPADRRTAERLSDEAA